MEKVGRLVQSSRPRSGLRGGSLVLLGLSMLLGALLANPGLLGMNPRLGAGFAQLLFLSILGMLAWWAWAQRRLSRLLIEVFEAVQLQRWEQAEPMLERILSRPIRHAQARCELLLSLAALAEARQEYDAAQRIFEVVLEEGRGDALQIHTARVALAAVMLRTGQTTDAITLVDRLTRTEIPEPLKAQVEMVSLFRELVMGQSQDNLGAAGERRRLFREHLSTRAGYGYALLAAAFDRANQPEEASRHWHDATLLVRPEELLGRFHELEAVAARYPQAVEVPL
jgi:tetratricopeptide (TPR) repeat protein